MFRVDNGGSDCISCFEIKIGADTPKLTNVRIADLDSADIWSEKVRCSSKIKPGYEQSEWY